MQEQYLKFIKQFELMGTTAIIADHNQICQHFVSGFQNYETNTYTDKFTIYKVASISKVIVALAIMKLIEKNKILLDEDISNYLGFKLRNPNFLDNVITIKMLMTQTSSLNDCGDGIKGYYGSAAGVENISLQDILCDRNSPYYDNNVWLKEKPGTKFNYCNLGCGILVCIVEKVTNEDFNDYIKKILFTPLNINAGFKLHNLSHLEHLAVHYRYNLKENKYCRYASQKEFLQREAHTFTLGNNFSGFAGGLYISGSDLAKIMMMLMNKGTYQSIKLFEPSTIELMMKTHWCGHYDNVYTKKGLQLIILEQYSKLKLYGHFGNAYGLRAFMLFNEKVGIIFIANGGNYLSNDDHLTPLLDRMIKKLLEFANICHIN